MLSTDPACLFIHIPKSAGNSIMKMFGIGWEHHKDLSRYREEVGADALSRLYKFTFVRNPWDRVLSEYNFQRKKHERPDTIRLFLKDERGRTRSFAEWVARALDHPEDHHPGEWGGRVSNSIHRMSPQIDWISLDGQIGVDFVGRVERLQDDFDSVCDALSIPRRRLPRKNRKFHWHYSRYYDKETRRRVEQYYAGDIEAFGYGFGD